MEFKKNILLIIDPQNDFHPGGTLAVAGANEDSSRTAIFIYDNIDKIDEIYVTLDSHHRNHIAHGVFWMDSEGKSPPPFTLITYEDVESGKWAPRNISLLEHCKFYTKTLSDTGKFTLCIWPEHCIIGTPGHNVVPVLNEAFHLWSEKRMRNVHYVLKGENNLTEMYSGIKADVELDDPKTKTDPVLRTELQTATKLIICGQALSHCVQFSTRDVLADWPKERVCELVVLNDCSSPVGGFEDMGQKFLSDMTDAGVNVIASDKVFS
jgi:nicotinamidase-related amidase